MRKTSIKISDMHCASCASNISRNLLKNPHVKKADVNFPLAKANVVYDEEKINLEEIEKIIKETGYTVEKAKKEKDQTTQELQEKAKKEKQHKKQVIFSIILTLPIFIRMFWQWEIPGNIFNISNTDWLQALLSGIVVFIFGASFHKTSFRLLLKKQTNMDTLISLGTLSAFFYSFSALFSGGHLYFESAATITSLILLGHYLELKTKNRASRAMEKLMELGVKKTRVIDKNGEEKEIDIEKVAIGDIMLIKPSEKIPLDGTIIEGSTTTNESMLTGESLPINKKINDKVLGATINLNGIIKVKVTKTSQESTLAQIIKTVEEAQAFKAPIQRLADKIASIFVPIVILISVLTFLTWYLLTGDSAIALINAVAVLIISCPCALGIATPIAVMVGTSVGAKNGILIKDGASFEKAKKIDTVIFDKTGTLTKGTPLVQEMLSFNGFSREEVFKISASLAKIKLMEINSFSEIPGKGLSGNCKEHQEKTILGNLELLKENSVDIKNIEKIIEEKNRTGNSLLFLAHGKKIAGIIVLADEIKANAQKAIEKIKEMGLEPIMLSGDNKKVAEVVAKKLDIKKYSAEILPKEKQEEVKRIQKKNKKVVFVGDGINDAPSLIQANLGIAMGSGTDIAKESGNIIIMKNDPEKIVEALKLSQKTFKIIKQNLFWAFFYNVLAIPLAAFGFVNPMVGAVAMGFSDVTVIGNSLRIYKK
jgi:Cu+-exporting ATPase